MEKNKSQDDEVKFFKGKIIRVTCVDFLREAFKHLLSKKPTHIGIDCEWKPEVMKGEDNPLELIQLSTGNNRNNTDLRVYILML